jgi:alkylation response protein AidB-like acyl-CoA dehydrogenase
MNDISTQDITDEFEDFLAVASQYLGKRGSVGFVRSLLTDERDIAFDRSCWEAQAQLGWSSIAIPESLGGAGFSWSAAGRLVQLCGEYLVPEPILSTIGLATPVLLAQGSEGAESILKRIGAGELVVAVSAPIGALRSPLPDEVQAVKHNDVWEFSGSCSVLDVPGSDVILVPVAVTKGYRWLAVDPAVLTLRDSRTLIDGRHSTTLDFDGVELPIESFIGPESGPDEALAPILTVGAALVSAWLLGTAERAFGITVDYLKVRSQFGALIGSYQALQHRVSRLYCELEVARAVVGAALSALDAGSPEAPLWASAARARTGDLALRVTSEAIQLHGGIGMTHEADVGLYFKSARVANQFGGDDVFHRARAGQLLGIEGNSSQ